MPTTLTLNGANRHEGDLSLEGGLTLDAALLFVNGNLTVNGNVTGYGTLVVTGDVTIESGVALQGATQVALLSGGSVDMQGAGPSSTVINGIFYARNGISAHEMTVLGTLVAGGESANGRQLRRDHRDRRGHDRARQHRLWLRDLLDAAHPHPASQLQSQRAATRGLDVGRSLQFYLHGRPHEGRFLDGELRTNPE